MAAIIDDSDFPPPPAKLERQHRQGIFNNPEEIDQVNNNRGSRVILLVNGGGLNTTWYYEHDTDGKFFKISSTTHIIFDPNTHLSRIITREEPVELDGPIDSERLMDY